MMVSEFTIWCVNVDIFSRQHLKCSWADLCGDMEPLISGFSDGLTPYEFVHNWAAKYDLDWYEEEGPCPSST